MFYYIFIIYLYVHYIFLIFCYISLFSCYLILNLHYNVFIFIICTKLLLYKILITKKYLYFNDPNFLDQVYSNTRVLKQVNTSLYESARV